MAIRFTPHPPSLLLGCDTMGRVTHSHPHTVLGEAAGEIMQRELLSIVN